MAKTKNAKYGPAFVSLCISHASVQPLVGITDDALLMFLVLFFSFF